MFGLEERPWEALTVSGLGRVERDWMGPSHFFAYRWQVDGRTLSSCPVEGVAYLASAGLDIGHVVAGHNMSALQQYRTCDCERSLS